MFKRYIKKYSSQLENLDFMYDLCFCLVSGRLISELFCQVIKIVLHLSALNEYELYKIKDISAPKNSIIIIVEKEGKGDLPVICKVISYREFSCFSVTSRGFVEP
jgi:hypothetical protein